MMRLFILLYMLTSLLSQLLTATPAVSNTYSISKIEVLGKWLRAISLNDAGQVVGHYYPDSGIFRAFFWENGSMTDLGTLGGSTSKASAINNSGQIVGYSTTISGEGHAFLWEKSFMTDLEIMGFVSSINDSGQVVGAVNAHAFLWEKDSLVDLGTLGGTCSNGAGINNSGQVVGYSTTLSGESHAFLWYDGYMTDLGTLGGSSSMANSINDSGQTVGSSTTLPGEDHAFLWEDGKIYDLNNMIDSSEGWILIDATDINNHGQIIGYGTHNGTITSFILTPIPYYINDGEIQLEESILALQVLTNVKKVHVSLDADVNNDGQIGLSDAISILKILADQ